MSNRTIWTSDMCNYVKEYYPKFMGSISEFVDIFNEKFGTNLSWTAIRSKANGNLKVTKERKVYKKWTPEMDNYLTMTYPTCSRTSEELAKIISDKFNVKVTKISIYNRIKILGLKKVEDWGKLSEEQVSYIKQCYSNNMSVRDITEAFNLKYETKYNLRTMKNIVYIYCVSTSLLTEEQLSYIKETYPSYIGTQKSYFKIFKDKFNTSLSLVSFIRIIRSLGLTKKSFRRKDWTSEMDKYLVKIVPSFEGNFEELAMEFNKKFNVPKTAIAIRARVEFLKIKKPPSYFSKWTPEMVAFVKENLPTFKGTMEEFEGLLHKTFKTNVILRGISRRADLKGVKKPSAVLVWTEDMDNFIREHYKKYTGKTKDLLEIFNKKFNMNSSLKAFQAHASYLFANRKYLVKELPSDMNKIDPMFIPHVRTSKDGNHTRHKISLARYNWLMAGKEIEDPENAYFIYWDDDTTNCDISNLHLVTKGVCSAYGNAKRDFPRGDVKLNKEIYKRVFLEQVTKEIK